HPAAVRGREDAGEQAHDAKRREAASGQKQPPATAAAQVERDAYRSREPEEQRAAPRTCHYRGGQGDEAEAGQERPPVAAVAGVEPQEESGAYAEQQRPEDAADAYGDRQPVDQEQYAYA